MQDITFNLRFAGQYYDIETDLHYNWHRDYNPKLGRYVQADPIGLEGGWNRYDYVGGNPIQGVDYDGLQMTIPVFPPISLPPINLPALINAGKNVCKNPYSCAAVGAGIGIGYLYNEFLAEEQETISIKPQRDARSQSLPQAIPQSKAEYCPPPPPPDCNQPKPQAERPSHMKANSDFANLVKWGTGPGEALARLGRVTAAEIAAMKDAGITPGMIRSWWQVYNYMRECVKLGKDQETPIYRAKLMEEILKKWGD